MFSTLLEPKAPARESRESCERGLFWAAAGRLLLAGSVFFVVYGACNRFTATRSDVGVWRWDWERHIPFVREFIVPYWSLDLFFCGAFFLCRNRAGLDLLTKRLVAVVFASGVCYLLMPLQMGVPRPAPAGWTAPLFRALYAGDLPYNLAPSLHISLRCILWVCYGAHLRGAWRGVAKFWFMLIGLSTLFVWQHHVPDVASGFLMGWAILAVLPDPAQQTRSPRSPRLALRYGLGGLGCAGLAFIWVGFAWPAVALAIVALAYATGRPHLLGKENGTLSPAAEWCLLPVLVGSKLIQSRWRKVAPAWVEITPGVFFGRRPTTGEAAALAAQGPLAVLDLTAERTAPAAFREEVSYLNLPLPDLVAPSQAALNAAVAFVGRNQPKRRVLIHCELGLQRSVRVVERWLVASNTCRDEAAARAWVQARVPVLSRIHAVGGSYRGDLAASFKGSLRPALPAGGHPCQAALRATACGDAISAPPRYVPAKYPPGIPWSFTSEMHSPYHPATPPFDCMDTA